MVWSAKDRIKAVQLYYREGTAVAAQRAFRRELHRRTAPERRTLLRWVAEFEERGTAVRQPRHTPRPRLPPTLLNAVRRAIRRSPSLSVRRLVARTGAARSTIHRILQRQLGLFPYKLQLVQRLKRGDKAKRYRFCKWALSRWRRPSFRKCLLMTDEARFHIDGHVNKQNCRLWGLENPHATVGQEQQTPSIVVWCGVWAKGIVGPYFFEEGGHPVMVNGTRYREFLVNTVIPKLQQLHVQPHKVWFQQDGATAHTTQSVLAYLKETFPGKVISKSGNVQWPPRSPDLSLCDFFLWGHLKAQVYRKPVKTLKQLKERIRSAVKAIPDSVLQDAVDALAVRLRECSRRRGAHFETVLLKQ